MRRKGCYLRKQCRDTKMRRKQFMERQVGERENKLDTGQDRTSQKMRNWTITGIVQVSSRLR